MPSLTLQVPESLYKRLKRRAEQSQRTVEAELLDLVATAVPQADELPAELAEAIAPLTSLDDTALWQAARTRFPQETATELEDLHLKRQCGGLTEAEAQTLAGLVRLYERSMLVRARAAALLLLRGHDVNELVASA